MGKGMHSDLGFYLKLILFTCLMSLASSLSLNEHGTDIRFTLKVKEGEKEAVLEGLQQHNFSLLFEITAAEPVRGYGDTLKPDADFSQFSKGNNIPLLANSRRFIIKVRKHQKAAVFTALTRYRYVRLYEITPETSVFEYNGHVRDSELELLTLQIKRQYRHKIISMESVIVYENTFKPEAILPSYTSLPESYHEIHSHYGMGVSSAHALGYTGKGVVVAVTDVGIDTGLLDLHENIDQGLCYNFINNSRNVTPEYFHHLQDTSAAYTAHGDHCASIIASVFGNGVCTFGIAFKATIVGLKIFMVTLYNDRIFTLEPVYATRSDIIARALVHNLSEIDIFSNAWGPTKAFTSLDLPTKEAVKYGAEKGRRGLGTIHVVPAGPVGNEFANNIYTIAVNGVGRNWSIPADSSVSANVITSGLSSGSNITADYMVTASQRNRCVTNFKGVSAATAQVAAIIALALEANPELTLRQLKRLLVQASEPSATGNGFSTNAAGHRFHKVFGFGLLNAGRLVILAKTSETPLPLLKRTIKEVSMRNRGVIAQEVEFCHSCDVLNDADCLDTVEDVVIKMRLTNYCRQLKIILVSPKGTESVLVPFDLALTVVQNKKIQLTSVHFWDEAAFGTWQLKLFYPSDSCGDQRSIQTVSLALYGTKSWKSSQQQPRLGQDECAGSQNNVHTTENVTSEKTESQVSVIIHINVFGSFTLIAGLFVVLVAILIYYHKTVCHAGKNPEKL